jgi:hypothetical protein
MAKAKTNISDAVLKIVDLYEKGYNKGYDNGYKDGRNCAKYSFH